MDDQDTIIDGVEVTETIDEEITSSDTAVDVSSGSDDAAVIISLDELIKNHIESIAKLRLELKDQREMYNDSFDNNPAYHDLDEKAKEATKTKLALKKQIGSQPSVATVAQKLKDLRSEISEKNQTLSDLVTDYKEKTGATQIETRDGKIMEIVSQVKLVKIGNK